MRVNNREFSKLLTFLNNALVLANAVCLFPFSANPDSAPNCVLPIVNFSSVD